MPVGLGYGDSFHWYLGGEDLPAEFDRATTNKVSPTGVDSARLTMGNYSESVHGYGLDRQFKGRLRGIMIFGSRAGPAGALPIEDTGAPMRSRAVSCIAVSRCTWNCSPRMMARANRLDPPRNHFP